MALDHKEGDRVPIDFGSTQMTGIMAVAYRGLRDILGMKEEEIKVYDVQQQLALISNDILKRFGVDVLGVKPEEPGGWKAGYKMTDGHDALFPEDYSPELQANGSKVLRQAVGYFGYNYNHYVTMRMPKDGYYYDLSYQPLKEARNKKDIDKLKWFWELTDSNLDRFEHEIARLNSETDYGILANTLWGGWGQHFEVVQNLRGWDTFLMDICTNKKLAKYMLEKRHENVMYRWDLLLDRIGTQCIQVVTMGDDLGMQTGPQMSREMYLEILKPLHKKFLAYIKKRTDAKVWMHSCGSIYELIPDFIEIGVDIINPVQITARDMDSRHLKKQFGKDIVFWGGGCDSQKVLPFSTPNEVKEEVKRRINDLAPEGGFVFAPIMNIQLDVPPQNIVAMFDAAIEYGRY